MAGVPGRLVDISVGGASVILDRPLGPGHDSAQMVLPQGGTIDLQVVNNGGGGETVSLQVRDGDWASFRSMALWLFHTPRGAVSGLPAGVPVVAAVRLDSSLGQLRMFVPGAPAMRQSTRAA